MPPTSAMGVLGFHLLRRALVDRTTGHESIMGFKTIPLDVLISARSGESLPRIPVDEMHAEAGMAVSIANRCEKNHRLRDEVMRQQIDRYGTVSLSGCPYNAESLWAGRCLYRPAWGR